MSEERRFGSREVSPVPFVIDSSDPSRPASPELNSLSGQGTPYDVWENGSDVMESLSSDVSAPHDSPRGRVNSQDSWNGDDEDSMSEEDLDEWLQGGSQQPHAPSRKPSQPKRRLISSSARSSRLGRESARMEPPPFLHNENLGLSPADEAEMLGDDEDDRVPTGDMPGIVPTGSNPHYHSDNDLSIHMQASISQNSSAIAYSESDLIGPNARDFPFPSPTVFPTRDAIIGISTRPRPIPVIPQTLTLEGNNENMPRRKNSGKRRPSSQRMVPPKPPMTLPTKTRLNIHIKKWNLGATWKWNAGDENCGICRMPFEACCTDCRTPGDDCPLAVGVCKHSFHMHCIVKWTESQNNPRPQCPLCRQEWIFATE